MFSLYYCTWRKKDTWFVHWPFSVSQNVCNVTSRDIETIVKSIFLRCLALGAQTFCNKNVRSVIIFIGKVLKLCVCEEHAFNMRRLLFIYMACLAVWGCFVVFLAYIDYYFKLGNVFIHTPSHLKGRSVCVHVCAHMCACLYAHAWVSVTDGYSHDSIIQSR